jgi:Putative translation factor (SUA5)
MEEFGKKIKYILDGGQSKIGLESTIVSLIQKPKIIRLGGVEKSKINKFLRIKMKLFKKSSIVMPGQSKLHYSPEIPIRLNAKYPRQNEAFILIKKRNFSDKNYFYLTKNQNLKEAAKNLYKTLRLIKRKKFKYIAIESIPNKGFGEAINDRIIRASKF